jgi:hypothetical protein
VAHEYPTEKVKKLMDINVMGKLAGALVRLDKTSSLSLPLSSLPDLSSR